MTFYNPKQLGISQSLLESAAESITTSIVDQFEQLSTMGIPTAEIATAAHACAETLASTSSPEAAKRHRELVQWISDRLPMLQNPLQGVEKVAADCCDNEALTNWWAWQRAQPVAKKSMEQAIDDAAALLSGKYPKSVRKESVEDEQRDTLNERLSDVLDPFSDTNRRLGYELTLLSEGFFSKFFNNEHPDTHVFYHEPTKSFMGHVNGQTIKSPLSEKDLLKHLNQHHGMSPEDAASMVRKFKAGISEGVAG